MTNEHTYPPAYTPGPHQPWYLNRAWEILDTIKPGVLDLTIRSFLAGQIAGSLETAAKYGAPDDHSQSSSRRGGAILQPEFAHVCD